MTCGQRLIEAQQFEEKSQARFQANRTQEGSEEWSRARRLVEDLASEYLAAVRAWKEPAQEGIGDVEPIRSQHISPAMKEQFLLAGLPESEVAMIAEHLRSCPECRCRKDLWNFWGGVVTGTRPSPL
jgi:hypothetical protein